MVASADSFGSNRLLASLPPEDLRRLMIHGQDLRLEVEAVLYEPGIPIEYIYFPRSGMASVVTYMKDGTSIEVMIVGREGAVGLPSLQSSTYTVPTRAFIQIAGNCIKINANHFRDEFQRRNSLRDSVFRYFQ